MAGRAAATGLLGVANVFALLRLLPVSNQDKDAEILALRHQITVLERQLGQDRVRFARVTGCSWPRCCTGSRAVCCAGHGCWCARTLCCAGTATSFRAATRPVPGRGVRVGRVRCARSAFSCCVWRGRIPAGALSSGVGDENLDELLSARGLLGFARKRGLGLERIEDLWLQPHTEVPDTDAPHAEVLQAFTTAIVTAVSVVAVTLDPESVYFVGRLRPLVDIALHQVRERLDQSLPAVPEIRTGPHQIGLSTAPGAVYACLTTAQERLRDAVLGARQQSRLTEQSAPAF